jgi:C4-dicarboxylate-specific signal transduction histidine kinase
MEQILVNLVKNGCDAISRRKCDHVITTGLVQDRRAA